MNVVETNLELCLQPNLEHPTVINPLRQEFENDYIKYGFKYVLEKYSKLPLKNRIKNWLKQFKIVNHIWSIYKRIAIR